MLQVEIGNYMQAFGPDRDVKNKWLWQGMNQLGIDVLNVAENDIDELIAQGVDYKDSDRFVSANLLSKDTGDPLLRPYVIKNISIPGNSKPFRLGFIGLSGRDSYLKTDGRGYIWADPLASAKKWLPELRQKCDFVVALACIPQKDAIQLAVDTNSIDIILNGFKHQAGWQPVTVNKSSLIYAEDEGRILGELRFTARAGQGDVKAINHVLTRTVPDDPEMAAFIAKAKVEISAIQNEIARANGSNSVKSEPVPLSSYVTSQNCVTCHQAQFSTWSKSNHSHAIETLKREKKEFDTSCVVCHATGMGKSGGFVDLYKTPELANVQCEVCHGPGREHSLNPPVAKMARSGPETCLGCHTESTSPEFEFASYWEKIKH
jgi:hypothetical protein